MKVRWKNIRLRKNRDGETGDVRKEEAAAKGWPGRVLKGRHKGKKAGFGGNRHNRRFFLILMAILLLILAAGYIYSRKRAGAAAAGGKTVRTASVERRDITSSLSASGTISPKDTYSITSMAEGEVIEAEFEEGDQVAMGQILYRIDVSSMESKLNSAENSLERAQGNYDAAAKDYSEALSQYSGNLYRSTRTGYIKTLHITEGGKVSANTQIADLYNDQVMKIRVPFLNVETEGIPVGAEAVLTLSDTQEQLSGIVTAVSSMDEALAGGRLIRYVTIQAENPGGLTADRAATAQIGEYYSSGDGTFAPTVDTVMGADLGSSVEVEALLVTEGDFVSVGSPIFQMKEDDAQKLIKSFKDAVDSAESSLEQAQSSLDTTQDSYDNYTITAPISGIVIKKEAKVGDKVQNGNSATALAVIYDMSTVTFDMNVDELDIGQVQAGQIVQVTADAFENQTFTGRVTKVSLEGASSNGVTYYPVTVTMDETGNFLPGMNVDGEIIVESAEDVIAVPADALMRGNKVYVKDDSVKEAKGTVPAGFREVEVEIGLINTDYVEIKSGEIGEGDEVYISQTTADAGGAEIMMPAINMGGAPGAAPGGQGNSGAGRRNSGGGQRNSGGSGAGGSRK